MTFGSDRRATDNEQAAKLGVLVVAASSLVVAATVWFLPATPADRMIALGVAAGALLVSAASLEIVLEAPSGSRAAPLPGARHGCHDVRGRFHEWHQPRLHGLFYGGRLLHRQHPVGAAHIARSCPYCCRSGWSARAAYRTRSG